MNDAQNWHHADTFYCTDGPKDLSIGHQHILIGLVAGGNSLEGGFMFVIIYFLARFRGLYLIIQELKIWIMMVHVKLLWMVDLVNGAGHLEQGGV